jgi:chromosome segregation ATPase
MLRQIRRELEEYKRRSQEMLSEATELRRERDAVKLDKNEQFVTLSRDLEEERTAKR